MKLLVEGWRKVAHSYAIINQFQLAELTQIPDVDLRHLDMPLLNPNWQRVRGILPQWVEDTAHSVPAPEPDWHPEVCLRFLYLRNPLSDHQETHKTFVFLTTEWGILRRHTYECLNVEDVPNTIIKNIVNNKLQIITPSRWSKEGLLRSNVPAECIHIVPHGIDPFVYRPLSEVERQQLRIKWGWKDHFVFLNVGAMTLNKGTLLLLRAFSVLIQHYQNILLVLKGLDGLYSSEGFIRRALVDNFTETEIAKLVSHIHYFGSNLSSHDMAAIYSMSDAYISPYLAEGFNMPVLEAIACGRPVICTAGGATDDFTMPDFALPIESTLQSSMSDSEQIWYLQPNLDSLIFQMERMIQDEAFRRQAQISGPAYVQNNHTWKKITGHLLHAFTSI